MKIINVRTAAENIKRNGWLLFSALGALCLFLSPSVISLLLIAAAFGAVLLAAAFDAAKPEGHPAGYARVTSLYLTLLLAFFGFAVFWKTWVPSSKLAALAAAIGLSGPVLLLLVGMTGCGVGIYAMYMLSWRIVSGTVPVLELWLPVQKKSDLMGNLKRNWYFPVSAMAFFLLNASWSLGYAAGLGICFLITLVFSSRISSIAGLANRCSFFLRLFSAASAVGICLGEWAVFHAAGGAVLSLAAVFFVYCCVLAFWTCVSGIFRRNEILRGIKTVEWVIYGLLLGASLVFMVLSFSRTDAFYGTEFPYDIIYTSDSPTLVKGNVYVALTHSQNDLRQPLFAVFSAAFTGIGYLVSALTGNSPVLQAMLVNGCQIILLFAANFMVAKMMKMDSVKRICFMVLVSCTYTQLLFTLMMEQYIVAYFWLIFCIYLIVERGRPDRIALWGAGGTLLTSMVLLPFLSGKSPVKDLKGWILDLVKYGLEFVGLLLVFCRFDVIFNLLSRISFLSGFTGKTVTFWDKLFQYTQFICSCFAAPAAGANTTACEYISWQLEAVSGIHAGGVVVLLLALVSAVWNRDKKSSLLAAAWVVFSIVMLLGLGWGTAENGLILYALYFGWAFLVLLFQLVERIGDRLGIRLLLPAASILAAALLLAVNIPAMMELIRFAVTHYPV